MTAVQDELTARKDELLRLVQAAKLTNSELDEGCEPPNDRARGRARRCVADLFEAFGLEPRRISADVTGGIWIAYEHKGMNMGLHADNDGELTGVVYAKCVLESGSVGSSTKTSSLVQAFRRMSADVDRFSR